MPLTATSTEKIEAQNVLKNLLFDSTFEDIQYHLYIAEKLHNTRQQIKKGNVHTQKEVEKRQAI